MVESKKSPKTNKNKGGLSLRLWLNGKSGFPAQLFPGSPYIEFLETWFPIFRRPRPKNHHLTLPCLPWTYLEHGNGDGVNDSKWNEKETSCQHSNVTLVILFFLLHPFGKHPYMQNVYFATGFLMIEWIRLNYMILFVDKMHHYSVSVDMGENHSIWCKMISIDSNNLCFR